MSFKDKMFKTFFQNQLFLKLFYQLSADAYRIHKRIINRTNKIKFTIIDNVSLMHERPVCALCIKLWLQAQHNYADCCVYRHVLLYYK